MQLTKLIFPKTHLFVFLNAHRFVLWIMDAGFLNLSDVSDVTVRNKTFLLQLGYRF